MGEFGVSQPVRRREDIRLLTGRGAFVDDAAPAGLAHGHVLRSPHAHATIAGMDVTAARAMRGVLAVYTAADLAADGIGDIPCLGAPKVRPGTVFVPHLQPLLVADRARFAGDAVAFVVAETEDLARDAAEAIDIVWEPLPATIGCAAAAEPGAAPVWDDAPGNVSFDFEIGDAAATEAAFARAHRVVALEEVNNRIVQNAIETRVALGEWDAAGGRMTLTTATQMPNRMKTLLAEDIFHIAEDRVRVLVKDVGGGFGGKNSLYPEQGLVLYAARRLGRSVKWVSQRGEAFLTDFHGRDNVTRGELALDADGRFLAIRVTTFADLGAYVSNGGTGSPTSVVMLPGTYATPAMHVSVRGMYTNTVPTAAYRGAGRPEITYLLERLVDVAAHDLGFDRIELRRRNFIPLSAFPYRTPMGLTYDPCDFAQIMDRALAESGWHGIAERRAAARARGRLRGIGFCNYVERCGGGGGLSEAAHLIFRPDGSVELRIGAQGNGQGHETAFSQIVNERLGLPFERIEIVQGDTDRVLTGTGTGGSWSIPMGGTATCLAADVVIEKARRLAAHVLEAAETDLAFADGAFTVRGTDLSIGLDEVARAAFDPARLPPDTPPGLDGEARYKPENYTYPYGCHVCEVEVDPGTGHVALVAYTAVHDFGRALNPMLLAGQVQGGVTQGIGQALLERTVYDGDGQLLTGSWMDYCLPRADDVPSFAITFQETPDPRNPLGVKGCGEAGATGAPPAVMNAVVDALDVRHLDMPATPERVWAALAGR